MKRTKSTAEKVCIILLILTQTILVLYLGHLKRSMFCDEFLSYGLSNSEDYYFLQYNAGWVKKDYFLSYLEVKTGTPFSLKAPYNNQINDVHPPLYYILLHIVCCIFRNSYSKWIGIGLNFAFLLLTDTCIYKICLEYNSNWKIPLLTVAVWSLSAAGLNTVLLIRMYMLQTLEILLLILIHIRIAKRNFKFNFKDRVFLFLNVIAGGLTQYYYYLFAGTMVIAVFAYLMCSNRREEGRKYLITCAAGVGVNILIFPDALNHIFREYRGTEVASNLKGRSDHPLKTYLGYINNSLFGGLLGLVLILFIISAVFALPKKRHHLARLKLEDAARRLHRSDEEDNEIKLYNSLSSNMKSIIISTIIAAAVFLYVAIAGSELIANRYIMPMYPLFTMGEIYLIYSITKNFGIRKQKLLVITTLLSLSLSILSLKAYGIDYLFQGYDETRQIAQETTGGKDCLLYCTVGRDIYHNFDLYMYCDETYIMTDKQLNDLAKILKERETDNDLVVNFDASLPESKRKQTIDKILMGTGKKSYQLLYRTDFMIVYGLR